MNIITLLKLLADSGAVSPKPSESATLKKRREFIELGLKRPD
jgi:hypothetical protein